MFEKNIGLMNRALRILAGGAGIAIGLLLIKGWAGIALAFISGVLVFSGAVGFCHVYKFFGICDAASEAGKAKPEA